jgi:hypothetical protein
MVLSLHMNVLLAKRAGHKVSATVHINSYPNLSLMLNHHIIVVALYTLQILSDTSVIYRSVFIHYITIILTYALHSESL